MPTFRLALANLRYPATREESVTLATDAIRQAADAGAQIICFPECFVPGYRAPDRNVPPADQAFLERAWATVAEAAKRAGVAVVLGTERVVDRGVMPTVLVINPDGTVAGFQDKVQLDPSEDGIYTPGSGRRVFRVGPLTFGVAICHEGFRYPETIRWAARRGAQLVFHPHFHWAEPGAFQPTRFGDPANTFHERAVLYRAAENTIFVATVNYMTPGAGTTSAVARPDGTLLAHQPYGVEGLLVADVDPGEATGLLAARYKSDE